MPRFFRCCFALSRVLLSPSVAVVEAALKRGVFWWRMRHRIERKRNAVRAQNEVRHFTGRSYANVSAVAAALGSGWIDARTFATSL